jgi:glucosylceramidase
MNTRIRKIYLLPPLITLFLLCGSAAAQREGQLVAQHSGKCLSVRNKRVTSAANGTEVWQMPCRNGYLTQVWRLEPAGARGVYYVVSVANDLVLDVEGYGTSNGDRVYLWEKLNGPNQKWRMTRQADGTYVLTSRHSLKCLDVAAISIADGAAIHQWEHTGGANQRWEFRPYLRGE